VPSVQIPYATPSIYARTSGMAIASLVCGCLMCVPLVPGGLATTFALRAFKATRDPAVRGREMAIAGLILGIANLLGWVAFTTLSARMPQVRTPAVPRSPSVTATQARCRQNMLKIGEGVLLYCNDHQGRFPDSIDELVVNRYAVPSLFICPEGTDSVATGATPTEQADNLLAGGHLSFVYVGKGMTYLQSNSPPMDTVLMYEPLSNHQGKGANFLFLDLHVGFMPAAYAKAMIDELNAGHNPPRQEKLEGN
jgi:prepilin-type processing-associated H-X9-DG protein